MSSCGFICFHLLVIFCFLTSSSGEILSSLLKSNSLQQNLKSDNDQTDTNVAEKVNIRLYYEAMCPGCRDFETNDFKEAIQKLNEFLNIQTYPYGNAETIERDGKITFECQHGPPECYGNMLHACALDIIKNHTQALLYNSCMMEWARSYHGSDDLAADKCGKKMSIDSKPIKECAKSDKGTQLLKHYGEESKKANFQYVPYVLINGTELKENFMKEVCAAFKNPPPACASAQ